MAHTTTLTTTIATDAMETTYRDVEHLIYNTIHRFIKRYGGDFEHLKSVCLMAYTNAYHEYDDTRASFVTKVSWNCWKDMLEDLRRTIRRNGKVTYKSFKGDEISFREPRFLDLLDSLSTDAKQVVKLVTETPRGLIDALSADSKTPRSCIRAYLKGLGWTASRITESFSEIRKALQ